MNIDRTDIQPHGIPQWVDFIRFSLADIVVRGEWDDFGMFRILNRISFMSTRQLIFQIYHSDLPSADDLPYTQDSEITVFDPFFRNKLKRTISELHHSITSPRFGEIGTRRRSLKPKRYFPKISLDEFLIKIFDTHNYILVIAHNNAAELNAIKPEFEILRKNTGIGKFLTRALLPFDGQECRMNLRENIDSHFAKLRISGTYIKAVDIKPEEQSLSVGDIRQINRFRSNIEVIFDEEYQRHHRSPLMRSFLHEQSDKAPGNVFFFSKIFSRSSSRFSDFYYYDASIVLGSEQEKHILQGLRIASRDQFVPFGSDCDNLFWQTLGKIDGPERIVATLKAPVPQDIRVFLENTLMSGATGIEQNAFQRKSITSIHRPRGAKTPAASEFTAVCLHYTLQLGAPIVPSCASNLSIVSLPFRCSGGIWVAACFLRENVGSEDDPEIVDQRTFEETYCIYHSLLRESERRFRRRAKEVFLETISFLAKEMVRNAKQRHLRTADFIHFDEYDLQLFNNAAINLARVFPFPLVHIDTLSQSDQIPLEELYVDEQPNPFFDRLTLKTFIGARALRLAIRSGFEQQLALGSLWE